MIIWSSKKRNLLREKFLMSRRFDVLQAYLQKPFSIYDTNQTA
jgi:hypothetical protein